MPSVDQSNLQWLWRQVLSPIAACDLMAAPDKAPSSLLSSWFHRPYHEISVLTEWLSPVTWIISLMKQYPLFCFPWIARELHILTLRAKRRSRNTRGKQNWAFFIQNYRLCLVPRHTWTTQGFIYFFSEGRLVCHHFGMCSKNLLELSIRAGADTGDTAHCYFISWNPFFFLFLIFFFLTFIPNLAATTAN